MPESHKISVTILVDGLPEEKLYALAIRVEEVIKSLLPEGEKQNWNKYQLSNRNNEAQALDVAKTLVDNGVKDNDTLSLTKRDGGGGFFDCGQTTCKNLV